MRRMIVHDEPEHRMGGEVYYREEKYMRDPELREAYECGRKQGWREAMIEAERGGYNERRDWREMPPMMREHPMHDVPPAYRHDGGYSDGYDERRHRDYRGRFM